MQKRPKYSRFYRRVADCLGGCFVTTKYYQKPGCYFSIRIVECRIPKRERKKKETKNVENKINNRQPIQYDIEIAGNGFDGKSKDTLHTMDTRIYLFVQ